MTILAITLLAVAATAVLAHPFWAARHGAGTRRDPAEELAEGIRRARERVYEEIRALQQERFLNILSAGEHEKQLRAARLRAAELVRQQQHIEDAVRDIERNVDEDLQALLTSDREQSSSAESEP